MRGRGKGEGLEGGRIIGRLTARMSRDGEKKRERGRGKGRRERVGGEGWMSGGLEERKGRRRRGRV